MKPLLKSFVLSALLLLLAASPGVAGEVSIVRIDGGFRVVIDGELFTEWRAEDWGAPYLYPVIGPNGECVTRHFPMKEGVEGEQTDHKHHRSIRFSHRDVNGFSFWAPVESDAGADAGYEPSIALDEVESMTSGETGELIFWNRWIGGGELVLRERVRLAFHPLPRREVLMDYDVELVAADKPVTFGDQKDGGLSVRVAGSMRVANKEGEHGRGTIVNGYGMKNDEAWGKRAPWCDYYGPDASGETVGIAIFDHPSNLRYPTHWHARTYGLLAANRFGTGHFEGKQGATRGDGDYTIEAGDSLTLRHRFYFHHGDPETADVAGKYAAYVDEAVEPAGGRDAE